MQYKPALRRLSAAGRTDERQRGSSGTEFLALEHLCSSHRRRKRLSNAAGASWCGLLSNCLNTALIFRMPDPKPISTDSPPATSAAELDPATTFLAAASLAKHLQTAGVQWLPTPDTAATENLAMSFATQTEPQDQPAVHPPQPKGQPQSTPAEPAASKPAVQAPATAKPSRRPSNPQRPAPSIADAKPYSTASLPVDQRQSQLATLQTEVAACKLCLALAGCRKQTVFGEGNPAPRIVFLGEAPAVDDDREGRPFVGKPGQLLTKMIEACTLSREEVYIMNAVKCMPPGNRSPEPLEVEQCRPYFEKQLELLQPEYIVCLGAISTQSLLRSKLSVGRLRGRFHQYFASKVIVTYHPTYLLRNPAAKKAAWEDLQMMLADAGIELGTP